MEVAESWVSSKRTRFSFLPDVTWEENVSMVATLDEVSMVVAIGVIFWLVIFSPILKSRSRGGTSVIVASSSFLKYTQNRC